MLRECSPKGRDQLSSLTSSKQITQKTREAGATVGGLLFRYHWAFTKMLMYFPQNPDLTEPEQGEARLSGQGSYL